MAYPGLEKLPSILEVIPDVDGEEARDAYAKWRSREERAL